MGEAWELFHYEEIASLALMTESVGGTMSQESLEICQIIITVGGGGEFKRGQNIIT